MTLFSGRQERTSRILRAQITSLNFDEATVEDTFDLIQQHIEPGSENGAGLIQLSKLLGGFAWVGELQVGADVEVFHTLARIPDLVLLHRNLDGVEGYVHGTPRLGPNTSSWSRDRIYLRATVAGNYAVVVI